MTEDRTWTLIIRCARPASRARKGDHWHVQPHRVRDLTDSWFGKDAEIKLTPRTATFTLKGEGRPPSNLPLWREHFASALSALFMHVEMKNLHYVLPRPNRTELREDEG